MTLDRELQDLNQRAGEWRERQDSASQRRPEFRTPSQLPVEQLYTAADTMQEGSLESVGLPGEFPYLRGIHDTGYRGRLWTFRMFAGFGRPQETNERFKFLLEQGQTGLSVAFDMPTPLRLRHRRPARLRRVRHLRRGGIVAGRHGDLVRWHSPRRRHHLHDHQRSRRHHLGYVHSPGREAGARRWTG